jgi:hypothetical protein
MASGKTTVASLIKHDSRMGFIDYHDSYVENNKEFLRGDMLEFQFTKAPKIVYFPGNDLINARLNSVNVGIDSSVSGITKQMRGGFIIEQRTGQRTNGSLNLQFVDREDQSLTYFFVDWRNKIADPDTKYSFRKDDLVAECKLILTNSSRIDVRTLTFYNCQLQDAPVDENGVAEDGSDRSDLAVSLSFEHYSREFNNI